MAGGAQAKMSTWFSKPNQSLISKVAQKRVGFSLVNQNLFHLNWSASESQSLRTHRRCNQYSKIKENKLHVAVYKNVVKNIFHNVRKCTEKAILKVIWVGKGALDAILSQINKKIVDRFHFQ